MLKSVARSFQLVTAGLICGAMLAPALAQDDYPSRPTRLIVGFAPGGPVDTGARLIGEQLTKSMGAPFVVENRPGANAMLAADAVKRAPADGYTIFVSSSSAITLNPHLHKDSIRYNPDEDFAPVATIMEMPLILTINPSDPKMAGVNTLQDLIALAKKHPGELTYGSAGPGNITQIAFELLSSRAGIKLIHVPYRGTASAQAAILARDVHMTLDSLSAVPHVKAGTLRALAISSNRRVAELPDVPTIAESGFEGFNVASWVGLFVPKATPQPIVDRLSKEVGVALKDPAVISRITPAGPVLVMSPSEFQARIKAESAELLDVIQKANITIQ